MKRIPSLDGIRAFSIFLVCYGHLQGVRRFPNFNFVGWFGDLAHLGVIIFFVISGFLITSLLMNEREKKGSISLRNFYIRRVLRIFPAFYFFIACLALASYFGWIHLGGKDFIYSLTYAVNYYPERSWDIGHLWSLSIEEQFYILWPLLFATLNESRAWIVGCLAFLAAPLVRAWMHLNFPPHSPWRDLEIFPAMVDSLAIGCLMALSKTWLISKKWYVCLTRTYWLAVLIPLILLINRMLDYTVIDLFGSPIMLISIAILIEASTRHEKSAIGRLLNLKPVLFVGVLSYSLYLWQQPFLDRHSMAATAVFPINVIIAFGLALISYYMIERPFLKLRRKFEHSSRTPQLANEGA